MQKRVTPAENGLMAKAQLSATLSNASGPLAGQVVSRGRSGLVVRSKPKFRYPKNAAVQLGNYRLTAANAAWNTLSVTQFEAWNRYAETLTHHNRVSGEAYHPTGKNAFIGLAVKFLQVNPAGSIPLAPPAGSFVGDPILVSASPTPTGIAFAASGPNGPATLTELLFQPLKNARRSPGQFYKSGGFVAFSGPNPVETLVLPAGWYAVAYRFVEVSTGRSTPLQPLAKLEVV